MVNICEYGIIWGTWQKLVRMVWDSVQSMTRCFLCFKICFYVDLWFAFKYRAGCQLCYAVLAVWIFVVCLASRRTELLPSLPAGQAARAICLRPTCHSPIQCSFGLHQLAFGWHEAFFFSLFVVAELHPGLRLSVTCFLLTGCSTAIWWLSMERCPARSWTSRLLVQRSMFATARLLQRMGWQVWRHCLGMHWYVEDPISELHTLWKYTKSQGLLMFTVFSASLWNNGPFGRANSGTPKFQKKIRGISCIDGDAQEADLCHRQQTSRLLKTLTTREVYLLITVQNAFIPQRSKICLLQFNFLLR